MLLSDFFKYLFLLRFECQDSSHIEIGHIHNFPTDDTRNVDDQDVCGLFNLYDFEFQNTKKK